MQDRANSPGGGRPRPAPREEGRECRKNSTHTPKLESTGQFIRKGIALHRQRVVSSEAENERDRVKVLRGTQKNRDDRDEDSERDN